MVEANVMGGAGLRQIHGAQHIGGDEGIGIHQRVVVVALCGEVDDGIEAGNEAIDQLSVTNIAANNLAVRAIQARGVGGIGESVQHRDIHIGPCSQSAENEVGTNKAGTTGDENAQTALTRPIKTVILAKNQNATSYRLKTNAVRNRLLIKVTTPNYRTRCRRGLDYAQEACAVFRI